MGGETFFSRESRHLDGKHVPLNNTVNFCSLLWRNYRLILLGNFCENFKNYRFWKRLEKKRCSTAILEKAFSQLNFVLQ